MPGTPITIEEPTAKGRKGIKRRLLQLVISAILLIIVYRWVGLKGVLTALQRLDGITFLQILLVYTLGQVLSAWKWRLLLEGSGIERTPIECVRAYFFGMLVNTIGVGTVGGDVARAMAILPGKGERAAAMASVVADRIQGLAVLATIAALSIAYVKPEVLGPNAAILSALLVAGVALGWWLGPKLLVRIFRRSPKYHRAAKMVADTFLQDPRRLGLVLSISAVFHISQMYIHLLMARGFGVDLPLSYIFATVPIVNIAATLPVSLNGLGVREVGYSKLFAPIGIPPEISVAFAAVWFACVTLVSLVGGAIFGPTIANRRRINREIAAAANENTLELEQQKAFG